MKIIFLGTNGWYTSPTGNTPCILIDSKEHYVVFDAGNGLYKLDQYITENKPISLFISHFHLDHTNGLHILSKFQFSQGIRIFVADGRKKDFDRLAHYPYTVGPTPEEGMPGSLLTKVTVQELPEGSHDIGFPLTIRKLFHAYDDHGFRVEIEKKTIVYSGDTGICPASYELAENADVLIHECSYIEPAQNDTWGHVDPTQAAQLAKDAHVKQLLLTHFDASKYDTLEKRKHAEEKAKEIFPNTIAATDDLIITL